MSKTIVRKRLDKTENNEEIANNPLTGKTYADADAFVSTITTIASAKPVLKKMARMIILLERRISELEGR